MAVYNMSKIKEWYEDFNSCKSNYLNNYYQNYKSSYIITNNDASISKMQNKLDVYYLKLKKAYSKVGNTWKNLYNDLMNADVTLAGRKSFGSINASGVVAKISNMPKLVEYKNDLDLTGDAVVSAEVVSGVFYTAERVHSQAMQTVASSVQEDANQVSQIVSKNIHQITENIRGKVNKDSIIKAYSTSVGVCVGWGYGPIGIIVGAVVGSKIGSKAVSQVVDAVEENTTNVIKQVNNTISDVKNANTVSEKLKSVGKGAVEILKKTGATIATVGISVFEGLAKLVEDVVDLVALVGTAVASIGTGIMDLGNLIGAKITGDDSYKSDYTKRMWEGVRSFVATDHVGNAFDKFYDNTSVGKWIKENAFAFDTTRAVTREISEVLGVIAITVLTAGVGGAVTGTATSVGSGISAAAASTAVTTTGSAITYGAVKTAEHTETNWQEENTSTFKGLTKGVLQGVADGAFFAIGSKGDQVLKAGAEAASKTALKEAGIEVTKGASKKILQESLKGLSKESAKALSKDLSKMLAKKTAFECGTAVAQDLGTIGIDTILSNSTVTDENGNVIKLNSLKDKWNYYYNKAGGTKGLAQSVITAGILSGLSDRADTTGLLKGVKQVQRQANKAVIKSTFSKAGDKSLDSLSKLKNKIDTSAVKQKVSNSVSNTKSKLSTTKKVVGKIGSNVAEYSKTKLKNVNLKFKNSLSNTKFKLANGVASLGGTAISLKNKLKTLVDDTINKINVKKQAKQDVKLDKKNTVSSVNNLPDSIAEVLNIGDLYNRYGKLNDSNRKAIQDVFKFFKHKIQDEKNIGSQNFVEFVLNNGNIPDIPDFLKFFNTIDENSSIGHLTINEAIAIHNYTVGSSNLQAYVGNNDIWNPPNPNNIKYSSVQSAQEAALNKKYLDSALSKGIKLKKDQIFYSGMSPQKLKLWGIGNGDINSAYSTLKKQKGKNLNPIKNYISTSPIREGAFDHHIVLWKIKGKKGQQIGSYINEISAYVDSDIEYEFLMKRNLTMKVLDVTKKNGKIIVDLEIVN